MFEKIENILKKYHFKSLQKIENIVNISSLFQYKSLNLIAEGSEEKLKRNEKKSTIKIENFERNKFTFINCSILIIFIKEFFCFFYF